MPAVTLPDGTIIYRFKCGIEQLSINTFDAKYELYGVCSRANMPIQRIMCTQSQYDTGVCTTQPPVIEDCEDWESDNTTSYTLVNGCITASSCDPDASTQSQQCNECITICNEDGEERRVCAIGNGQWILYDPSGEHKGGRYDATGERQEILDAGETGGYLPSERFNQG